MITLSLITLIAIIQAYRSYPKLDKLAGYTVAPLLSNQWYLNTPVEGGFQDWSLNNPKLGTVYGHSATKRA